MSVAPTPTAYVHRLEGRLIAFEQGSQTLDHRGGTLIVGEESGRIARPPPLERPHRRRTRHRRYRRARCASRFVIVAFESLDKARAWYDSPAYSAIRPIRQRASKTRGFIVEGIPLTSAKSP